MESNNTNILSIKLPKKTTEVKLTQGGATPALDPRTYGVFSQKTRRSDSDLPGLIQIPAEEFSLHRIMNKYPKKIVFSERPFGNDAIPYGNYFKTTLILPTICGSSPVGIDMPLVVYDPLSYLAIGRDQTIFKGDLDDDSYQQYLSTLNLVYNKRTKEITGQRRYFGHAHSSPFFVSYQYKSNPGYPEGSRLDEDRKALIQTIDLIYARYDKQRVPRSEDLVLAEKLVKLERPFNKYCYLISIMRQFADNNYNLLGFDLRMVNDIKPVLEAFMEDIYQKFNKVELDTESNLIMNTMFKVWNADPDINFNHSIISEKMPEGNITKPFLEVVGYLYNINVIAIEYKRFHDPETTKFMDTDRRGDRIVYTTPTFSLNPLLIKDPSIPLATVFVDAQHAWDPMVLPDVISPIDDYKNNRLLVDASLDDNEWQDYFLQTIEEKQGIKIADNKWYLSVRSYYQSMDRILYNVFFQKRKVKMNGINFTFTPTRYFLVTNPDSFTEVEHAIIQLHVDICNQHAALVQAEVKGALKEFEESDKDNKERLFERLINIMAFSSFYWVRTNGVLERKYLQLKKVGKETKVAQKDLSKVKTKDPRIMAEDPELKTETWIKNPSKFKEAVLKALGITKKEASSLKKDLGITYKTRTFGRYKKYYKYYKGNPKISKAEKN
jgi:hypothetical protein